MDCSHIKSCELFVQFALNPALQIWKKHYCHGTHSECVRYKLSKLGQPIPLTLLPNGKRIEVRRNQDEFGITALFNCIEKDRVRMARSLIKTTVKNINVPNVEGTTALMAAVETGSEEMVKLLLASGSDTNLTNMHGQTAHDIAVEQQNAVLTNLLSGNN